MQTQADTVCFLAPSNYHIEVINRKYLDLIANTLMILTNKNYILTFESKEMGGGEEEEVIDSREIKATYTKDETTVKVENITQPIANQTNSSPIDIGLNPKYIVRKGNHVIYFKDSESIEDILAIIGAQTASLHVMGIKIEKDVKNTVNRRLNFEMSNINKTVNAAKLQVEAIELIESKIGISSLPENLQELAHLRLENPEASLSELENLLSEPISRSGINHRLSRIVKFSEKIKMEN